MVHVGVEHRDALEALAQGLRRNGRVVDVTEPAGSVVSRVMPRWAAQCVGGQGAVKNSPGGRNRALGRPVGRAPGELADGATAVRQVARSLGEDAAQGVGFTYEDVGHDFVTPLFGDFFPALMGFLEEGQVRRAVDGQQRVEAKILRLLDVEAQGLCGQQQVAGALRDFLWRAHLPTGVVAARMVQELFGVEKRTH